MTSDKHLTANVPEEMTGMRLDKVLALLFPDYSRARLQDWTRSGLVLVDARQLRPRDKVQGGEKIEINAVLKQETPWQAEAIPLEILFEDDVLLVINKPPGLVMHPAAGNREGTLLNALLHYAPELAAVPRAGIVHRLDKDTSGLLVVARSLEAQKSLVEQIQARTVKREYQAVVNGVMTGGGKIDQPIGRHPHHRTRMAVNQRGKMAVTNFRVLERFRGHTYIDVQLETGRTHQIRVHLSHLNYPIVGDPVYCKRMRIPAGCSQQLIDTLQQFKRQALHAVRLTLEHPGSGESVQWQAPLPDDMRQLLTVLREDVGHQ